MRGSRVLRATGVVLAIRLAMWCLPYTRVVEHLTRRRARLLQRKPAAQTKPAAVAWRVAIAGRIVPRSTCLVKALAGQQLLAAAGHDSTVRFGVALAPDGPLAAHAWLECDGRVLLGGDVSEFTVLAASATPDDAGHHPAPRQPSP